MIACSGACMPLSVIAYPMRVRARRCRDARGRCCLLAAEWCNLLFLCRLQVCPGSMQQPCVLQHAQRPSLDCS
jgi:hypothetical protein